MRENPAVDEGELGSFGVLWERDTRNEADNPTRGGWMTAGWEWFGDDFGGDYRFQRGVADLRRYVTVSPGYWFDVRLVGGTIRDAASRVGGEQVRGFEAIPFQERFYLGGIGTMRATVFKSLEGDRMFLGNAEIRVEVIRQVHLAFFVDAGDAWVAADSDPDLKVDGGIGLQDADSNVRLNLATKLDGRGGDVTFSGRIQRMF
jgi:outer membrane protein assembly factor BamA